MLQLEKYLVFSIIEMFSLGTLIFEAEISISNYGFHNVFEKYNISR